MLDTCDSIGEIVSLSKHVFLYKPPRALKKSNYIFTGSKVVPSNLAPYLTKSNLNCNHIIANKNFRVKMVYN